MLNLMKAVVFILCFLYSYTAFTAERTITVSLPSFAPFYFPNNHDDCQGVGVDVLNMISKQSSLPFKVINYPYARILHTLKSGQLDGALIFKNARIKNDVDYIGPVSKSKVIILSLAEVNVERYADLSHLKSIAVIRNASFEQRFDHDDSLNKFSVANYKQAMKMLKLKRIDAVVGSLVGLEYASKVLDMPFAQFNVFQLGEKEWWLHVSKKTLLVEQKQQLRKAVKHIYQANLIYQSYQKYMQRCQVKERF